MGWQEQRRLSEAARAEQARQDALAAAQVEQVRARTRVETAQAMQAQRAELARQRVADREARRNEARARRRARWAGLRVWCAAHTVDLLIYPLALVSAVMAVPAMAEFGHEVYGTAAGYALPVITELGMWAFAFAVHVARARSVRDGQDRPVWALQFGVWSFATVAAALNFLHGVNRPEATPGHADPVPVEVVSGISAGLVMATASVAGVVAHQLVTAAPRRGRAERDAARIERRAAAKITAVRRAAVRAAVAEIDPDATARLLFTPGHYRLTRSWVAPWRRRRLDSIALPDQRDPLDTPGGEWDALDRELAVLLTTVDPYPGRDTGSNTGSRTGVGMLDHDPNQRESTPIDPGDSDTSQPSKRSRSTRKTARASTRKPGEKSNRRSARSIDALRAELDAAIEADPTSIDPTSAESIRRALRCSPARARQLRDTYRPNH